MAIRPKHTRQTMLPTGKCMVCGLEAGIIEVERLPNNGIVMKALHKGDVEHKWSEYGSFVIPRKDPNPTKMICPKCGKEGRVNSYHPRKREPERVEYYIAHEKQDGTWGKKHKIQRLRRCYIVKITHRNAVLKRLGRYIP